MSTYTDELQTEIERVTLRGNADKATIRKLASIIFRMDQRLRALEGEIVVDDKPEMVEEVKEAPKPASKSIRQVQPKSSASKKSDQTPSSESSEA